MRRAAAVVAVARGTMALTVLTVLVEVLAEVQVRRRVLAVRTEGLCTGGSAGSR